MRCSSDVLKKTSPLDVFGDVSEKVKHLTNDASNDVSPPALHACPASGTTSFYMPYLSTFTLPMLKGQHS